MSTFSSGSFGRMAGFWLIVTAVIELALAAVFVYIGMTVPFVDFGMYLTAAILGITGIVLLLIGLRVRASAAANERLLSEGLAGTATITGLTQTGMYLNENPQVAMDLMVDVGGRPPYPARRKEFVPLILLSRLSSGVPLPVRVDRADPQRLVIDWARAGVGAGSVSPVAGGVFGAPGTVFASPAVTADQPVGAAPSAAAQADAGGAGTGTALAGLPFGLRAEVPAEAAQQLATMRAWLRQSGEVGTARIDDATDTGVFVGNDRLFTISATLELPGRAPEKLPPVAAMVAPDDVAKVREGYRVSVRVAPDNHALIDFDW